jgi:hypothetical protein
MYYEPKEYENLVSYFSSPIFNAFIMMENFYEAREDAFKVFKIEDEKTRDYFNMCRAMFDKNGDKKNIAEDSITQDS